MRTPARLVVALALAGLLGQSVGALADNYVPPPPPTDPPAVKYSSDAVPPGGEKTTLGASSSWTTRTGYSTPGRVAGPSNTYVSYPPPPIGKDCWTTYKAGVNLDAVAGSSRRATWVTPAVKFGAFHADQSAPSFYPLDSTLTTNDVSPLDTSVVNLNNNTTTLPSGFAYLGDAIQNAPQHGMILTYVLRGKIADANGTHVCDVTSVVEQGHTPSQSWCTAGEAFNGLNNHCSVPSVQFVPPASPLCAPPATCIPAVDSFISLSELMATARSIYTDGGTVVASPRADRELVQLPATFTLTGGPVDTPAQYMQIEVPITRGTSVGVASYQIRILYAGSDWHFDDHSTIGPYPAEHRTDMSFNCGHGPQCLTTQTWIGHWQVRVVNTFNVEFRSIYYWTYPGVPMQTDWAPFPGAAPSFQLCTKGATDPPPTCGPGIKTIFGQLESIPFVMRSH